MEKPSWRANMVAILLPCTYSIAAQKRPSISPAPERSATFWLLRDLVLSASARMRSTSAFACSSGISASRRVFKATVCPLDGSLALWTEQRSDLAISLSTSKRPIFVDISRLPRALEQCVREQGRYTTEGKVESRIPRRNQSRELRRSLRKFSEKPSVQR